MPFHALAALLSRHGGGDAAQLLDVSNLAHLDDLIQRHSVKARELRRTTAAADSARLALSDVAQQLLEQRGHLRNLQETHTKAAADLDRRATRVLVDAREGLVRDVGRHLASLSSWADDHYREEDSKVVSARLETDLSEVLERLEPLVTRRADRVKRKLEELGAEVATQWAGVEAARIKAEATWHSGLPSKWRQVGARGVVYGAAALAGFLLTGPAMFVAPVAIKAVGDKLLGWIPWFKRDRAAALSRRRTALQSQVAQHVDALEQALLAEWEAKVDQPARTWLDQSSGTASDQNETRSSFIEALEALAVAVAASIAAVDVALVLALLELEGHPELLPHVERVIRRPGGQCVIALGPDAEPLYAALCDHPLLHGANFIAVDREPARASLSRILGRRTSEGWRAVSVGSRRRRRPDDLVVVAPRRHHSEARLLANLAEQVLQSPVLVAHPPREPRTEQRKSVIV